MSSSDETSGYVPVSEWPSLTSLSEGFHEHLMPQSNKLAGKYFDHTFSDGSRISHHFVDEEKITWKMIEGGDMTGKTGDEKYKAFEVRPNMFLVDFNKPAYDEHVSIFLDTTTDQAVIGLSGMHEKDGQKRTWTVFFDAVKSGNRAISTYQPTEELIGKHILYRYNPRDAYEHMYLNKGTFVWHALSGTEKGLADAEPCKMLKLGEDLYLLFWTETIMPVESVVIVDLKAMRSTGRFFCWDPEPKKMVHMIFGSYATVMADTNVAAELTKPIRARI